MIAEVTEDNKRKCKEDDLPSNKKMCLSPSIIQDDNLTALIPSAVHDSPSMPVPSSSHDPSVTPPQSSSHDAPVKVHTSPHERPATPPQSSAKDLVSSPSSHHLLASHDGSSMPLQPNPVNSATHPVSHDSTATPPKLQASHSGSHDLDKHDGSLLDDSLSTSPPLLNAKQQDQLEFGDPDIINTQLNQQISEVQHFLKSDRLKRTKLPDTNNVQ